MLAYVDDCLPRNARAAVEEGMIESPEIAGQIDLWLLQNEAIRAAFPDPSGRAQTVSNSFAPPKLAANRAAEFVRAASEPDRRPNALPRTNVRLPRPNAASPAPARPVARKKRGPAPAQRICFTLAGAMAFWAAGALFGADQSKELARAATAAYHTFSESGARPVEIASSDREALSKWFAAQMPDVREVPDLAASGFVLLGGRIVPGGFSPAEYLVYENPRHERIALQIEALNAPRETDVAFRETDGVLTASWTGSGGGFALLGHAPRARFIELARLIRRGSSEK